MMWELVFKYHKSELDKIKKFTNASYVSYERYKDQYRLKYVRNKITTYFKLDGTPSDVTPKRYNELLNTIITHNGQA